MRFCCDSTQVSCLLNWLPAKLVEYCYSLLVKIALLLKSRSWSSTCWALVLKFSVLFFILKDCLESKPANISTNYGISVKLSLKCTTWQPVWNGELDLRTCLANSGLSTKKVTKTVYAIASNAVYQQSKKDSFNWVFKIFVHKMQQKVTHQQDPRMSANKQVTFR